MSIRYPKFILFTGALCISTAPIFVSLINQGAAYIGALRCLTAGIILLPVAWFYRSNLLPKPPYRKRYIYLLTLACLIFTLDLIFWHKSVRFAGSGISTILGNTQAIYLAIIGIIYYRERPPLIFYLALLLAFLGIYILTNDQEAFANYEHYIWGVIYGLITGICYALYVLCLREIEKMHDTLPAIGKILSVSWGSGLMLLLVAIANHEVAPLTAQDIYCTLGLACLVQILGWSLITSSLPFIPASIAGILILMQPVGATIMGVFLLDEPLSSRQVIGAALTLISIYLVIAPPKFLEVK